MADERISGLLKKAGLRVLYVQAAGAAQHARELARLGPTSAAVLAQGLVSAAVLGTLQKSGQRMNLQLECDGALRGLFVDGDAAGNVRGYVKARQLAFSGDPSVVPGRAVYGNKGFLSVLRDQGDGEHYRSSIALHHFELAADLEEFFKTSDQVDTRLAIELLGTPEEPLGTVAALLLQRLPDGDAHALSVLGTRLVEGRELRAQLSAHPGDGAALLRALFPNEELELLSTGPVRYTCSCSKDRVLNALAALGKADLEDLLAKQGQAEVTCEFCATHYVISGDDIRQLLAHPER